jgi:hypothetical protein
VNIIRGHFLEETSFGPLDMDRGGQGAASATQSVDRVQSTKKKQKLRHDPASPVAINPLLQALTPTELTGKFNEATAEIARLKGVVPPDTAAVGLAVQEMLAIKAAHRAKTFRPSHGKGKRNGDGAAATAGRGSECYPSETELPTDPDDRTFVLSFAVGDAAATTFFQTFGFVVFREVIDAAACSSTREEIHAQLEHDNSGFVRDDSSTWHVLSSQTYGLPPDQAIFSRQLVCTVLPFWPAYEQLFLHEEGCWDASLMEGLLPNMHLCCVPTAHLSDVPSLTTRSCCNVTPPKATGKPRQWHGARFPTEMCIQGCHWIPRIPRVFA